VRAHKLLSWQCSIFRIGSILPEVKPKPLLRPVQIFESHSKLDEKTCNEFDIAAAREGVKIFRSEYETITPPAWETIKTEMERSRALFLLVGPELVKSQEQGGDDWKYTQNWIAYEVGLACALGIDVWVLCDKVDINFPVPYLNNYSIGGIQTSASGFERIVFRRYLKGETYPFGRDKKWTLFCPIKDCGAKFNFHNRMEADTTVNCPTCLKSIKFPEGWPSK